MEYKSTCSKHMYIYICWILYYEYNTYYMYNILRPQRLHQMQQRTHSSLLIKGYPMTIINKQWHKVVNIQRVNQLKCKEIRASGRLPIIQTYHPSVELANKTMIKEFRNYSKLTSLNIDLMSHQFVRTDKLHSHKIKFCTYCSIYRQ